MNEIVGLSSENFLSMIWEVTNSAWPLQRLLKMVGSSTCFHSEESLGLGIVFVGVMHGFHVSMLARLIISLVNVVWDRKSPFPMPSDEISRKKESGSILVMDK